MYRPGQTCQLSISCLLVALPVTLPVSLPVALPVSLPVTLPVSLPVTLPVALWVALPVLVVPSCKKSTIELIGRPISGKGVPSFCLHLVYRVSYL